MLKKISETMYSKFSENKDIDYICLKIGDKTYSTNYEDIKEGKIHGQIQVVETKGIGEQAQLWIKSAFSEQEQHKKLPSPLPFELNVYFHNHDT